ncbi:MAG: hypothetical protein KJN71_03340 [Acidimicrobiia bacterium]|nr:hypothetical protein [Acidimicrobiia bacterium]NNC75744.1 hypothetical protein [Acidimicrobiia bacterium]
MARLHKFPDNRFVGTRDDMVVYDCDDASELSVLEERLVDDDLLGLNLLQTFGPDTVAEARNRGFSAL